MLVRVKLFDHFWFQLTLVILVGGRKMLSLFVMLVKKSFAKEVMFSSALVA